MTLRVTFDLDEDDLKHFRLIMREARKAATQRAPEDIVAAAEQLLWKLGQEDTPKFVEERLGRLKLMIRMISDVEWRLPQEETARVLNALAYFAEPEDLIPDEIPGLGFL
ncbi:MAG: YkvA family protein, partial [Woeseiaceae bacterium]|nr:YkvA family protein [Woeseiaceae bacterium]